MRFAWGILVHGWESAAHSIAGMRHSTFQPPLQNDTHTQQNTHPCALASDVYGLANSGSPACRRASRAIASADSSTPSALRGSSARISLGYTLSHSPSEPAAVQEGRCYVSRPYDTGFQVRLHRQEQIGAQRCCHMLRDPHPSTTDMPSPPLLMSLQHTI